MPTTANSSAGFRGWWAEPETLWRAAALLARWFRFQPGEIDGLDMEEFTEWVGQANRQIGEVNAET